MGRETQGVRVINLKGDDRIASVARVNVESSDENGSDEELNNEDDLNNEFENDENLNEDND